jgi:hypothetical protein
MRLPLFTLVAATMIVPPAVAEDIDQATIERVTDIATSGYADPGAATVTGVFKSLARNGMGYCGEVTVEGGEVTVEGGGSVTVFHVLLETAGGPSVLRLADYPDTDMSPNAQTVRQLMKNFGCTE